MIDAVVGAVIMVVATTSLIYAIEVAEKAFNQTGRYLLSPEERVVLESVELSDIEAERFWRENIENAPREAPIAE